MEGYENQTISTQQGFFANIKDTYGQNTFSLVKQWANNTGKLANLKNRRIFLLKCRSRGLIPKHVNVHIKCMYPLQMDNHPFTKQVDKIEEKFKKSVLNLEIDITIWKLKNIDKEIEVTKNLLKNFIPQETFLHCLNENNTRYNVEFNKVKVTNLKKLQNLENERSEVCISTQDKFLYNFTDAVLPQDVRTMLSLGPKFGLPIKNSEIPIPTIIKDLEYCISRQVTTEQNKEIIRAQATNIITNHYCKNSKSQTTLQASLQHKEKLTKQFIKEHPRLWIMKSDKGNSTVVMEKEEYHTKVSEMLQDTSVYQPTRKDPTNRFQTRANDILKILKNEDLITANEEKSMKTTNAVPPRLYCLRKTHKPGLHLRPVVSCIGSPGYNLAKFLHNVLSPLATTFHFNIKDSFEFVELIQRKSIPDNYVLVSLDVVSLFTNIPKQLVKDIISKQYKFLSSYIEISKKMLLEIVDFCFDTSYFTFDQDIYLQKDGTAMGNPASPILANLVMNYVVTEVTQKLPFSLPFFYIFVDDSCLAAPADELDFLLTTFNSFHRSLQFTMEVETDGKLCFLDTEVHRETDGSISTNWYSKPSSSGRILNFLSNHPTSNKVGIINGLLYRATKLSSQKFHNENMKKIKTLLRNNNYPTKFVNISINKFNNKTPSLRDNSKKYYKFPYIEGLSQQVKRCFKDMNTELAFYNVKTTKGFFTRLKDPTPTAKQSNLIYHIPCECGKSYVGQTKQYLERRIRQHKNDCRNDKRYDAEKTALSKHHFDLQHNFRFQDTTILDNEPNYSKRLISEMIQIHLHDTINLRTDVRGLSTLYCNLLDKYKSQTNKK